MSLAPIALFVYNRPKHTEAVLKALLENDLADQSILYIFADGPKETASEAVLEAIAEVKSIIRKNKWCKEVHIFEAQKNKGLANSVIDGINYALNTHERIIVLEDDIVPSIGFLKYMNEGLEIYKDSDQVYGISAYQYPSSRQLPETYFLPIGSSWGWATWRRAWSVLEPSAELLIRQINKQEIKKFNFGGYPFYQMLLAQKKGLVDSWAIRFYASFFLQKGMFLFPNACLVKNIGFDRSGTHCAENDFFSNTQYGDFISVDKKKVELNKAHIDAVKQRFKDNINDNALVVKIVKKVYSISKDILVGSLIFSKKANILK